MIQNPGWVLCHIFMVRLLSQVMDNAIVNVNVVKAKDSAILAEDEDVIDPNPDADAGHDEDQGDVDELGIVFDSDSDVIVVSARL
jgi:hypothetical protein